MEKIWKCRPYDYVKRHKVRRALHRFLNNETSSSPSGVDGLLGSGLGASERPWSRRGMVSGDGVLVLR